MKLISAIAAAAVALTSPAYAANSNFTGPRVEATVGVNDVSGRVAARNFDLNRGDFHYGAAVGLDVPVGDSLVAGVEGDVSNVFDHDRSFGANARLGYSINNAVLVYGKVGYENYRDVFSRKLDGFRYGGGLEVALGSHAFVKGEYRRTNFENQADADAAIVGVGLRF